jgi:phenylalanyl-tRNA synthetase beta chain
MAENLSVMRVSLIPGLLRSASTAARRGESNARLFEEGRVFLRRLPGAPPAPSPAEERWAAGIVLMGTRGPAHFQHHPAPVDVLALKGLVIEALVAAGARREAVGIVAADVPRCAPGAAEVLVEGARVGWLGRVHPDELRSLEIDGALLAAELDLTSVLPSAEPMRPFTAPSRFPRVTRDVSVLVDRNRNYGAIIETIQALSAGENDAPVESIELIGRYLGAGVPGGKVSLTFSVAYRSPARTLTQDEVDRRHAQLVETLVRGVGATLRT